MSLKDLRRVTWYTGDSVDCEPGKSVVTLEPHIKFDFNHHSHRHSEEMVLTIGSKWLIHFLFLCKIEGEMNTNLIQSAEDTQSLPVYITN